VTHTDYTIGHDPTQPNPTRHRSNRATATDNRSVSCAGGRDSAVNKLAFMKLASSQRHRRDAATAETKYL